MLIGFSGPSGSGKTTLVNAVAEKLRGKGYDVGVVKEVARDIFELYRKAYGFTSLDEIRRSKRIMAFQAEILLAQDIFETEALEEHEIVLSDRTIYDNLFFTLFWYNGDLDSLNRYIEFFAEIDRPNRYKLIFLCEPVNGPVDDGFRTPDLRYRKVQYEVIKRLLPHYTVVPNFSVEKRVDFVVGVVEKVVEWGCIKR